MALQPSLCSYLQFEKGKRLVKKSLHQPADFEEIISRIHLLSPDSENRWGRMNAAQMLTHCDLVLQVAIGKIQLPKINFLFKEIGILTKKEMQIFNNGIPKNMPTFKKLIVNFDCDFDTAQSNLLERLYEYRHTFKNHQLPLKHELFGEMTEKDWGFLEFKHLNHHLKQFNV